MSVYPSITSVPYKGPVGMKINFRTLIADLESGNETRKRKWRYPKRDVHIDYENTKVADAQTLWQFYIDRSGSYQAFVFFDRTSRTYESEYVGTGDGSTTVWNLPFKSGGTITLYLDGVSQTVDVDWTFSALGGADGEDKATFTSAPDDGAKITVDFTGLLKVRCRFMYDYVSFSTFYAALETFGIDLKGLLNS